MWMWTMQTQTERELVTRAELGTRTPILQNAGPSPCPPGQDWASAPAVISGHPMYDAVDGLGQRWPLQLVSPYQNVNICSPHI